ncbi:hypothetical protein BS78_05G277400 [Paspalum vaginatum]|nr:hypothetical protein BS78_05G277400 [Paspalum vaginatum]
MPSLLPPPSLNYLSRCHRLSRSSFFGFLLMVWFLPVRNLSISPVPELEDGPKEWSPSKNRQKKPSTRYADQEWVTGAARKLIQKEKANMKQG